MRKLRFIGFTLILAFSLCALAPKKSQAFIFPIPVTDALTLGQNIVNDIKMVLEAKFTQETMRLAGKMNNTIGLTPFDPKKLFEDGYISKGEDKGSYGEDEEV